ncbi:hypothetical protein CJJ23_01885 [Mycoplasmopsis agassizii]|uniref:Uncharacterized protein n=1 Tax=Mycoplasmopsis agassizii TaxID=33922 RepID=A0A269TJD6_9BACT|nr:hypothetical protein [Mycoplasmopsis agassizii]PAK21521.1 hypothetical protein CJJ23_01885 [Mycoplasmopsis agassizii]
MVLASALATLFSILFFVFYFTVSISSILNATVIGGTVVDGRWVAMIILAIIFMVVYYVITFILYRDVNNRGYNFDVAKKNLRFALIWPIFGIISLSSLWRAIHLEENEAANPEQKQEVDYIASAKPESEYQSKTTE